jgi:hypothetical protein
MRSISLDRGVWDREPHRLSEEVLWGKGYRIVHRPFTIWIVTSGNRGEHSCWHGRKTWRETWADTKVTTVTSNHEAGVWVTVFRAAQREVNLGPTIACRISLYCTRS